MRISWAAGGLLSIIGALCYAELAAAYPSMGGDYHFLHRAFGPRLAFLYAWARATLQPLALGPVEKEVLALLEEKLRDLQADRILVERVDLQPLSASETGP